MNQMNLICVMTKLLYNLTIFFTFYIMSQFTRTDFNFTILDEIETKYPELVELIL